MADESTCLIRVTNTPEMLVRLLQLASPMLPIGAFSYSSGLEAAIEAGDIHDAQSGALWIGSVLEWSLARQDAPLAAAAHVAWTDLHTHTHEPDRGQALSAQACRAVNAQAPLAWLQQLNDLAFATRETAEQRLECTQTGHSLGVWIERSMDPSAPVLEALRALAPIAYPTAWAGAGVQLQLSQRETVLGLLWGFVENQISALMKALPLGQTPAQRMLLALGPQIERAADEALLRAPLESGEAELLPSSQASQASQERISVAGAMPALAIASMRHETQYSRLFRS